MIVLILSRREAECICLGDEIVLTIVSVGSDKVRIGVEAPPGVRILRRELEIESPTLPLLEASVTQATASGTPEASQRRAA